MVSNLPGFTVGHGPSSPAPQKANEPLVQGSYAVIAFPAKTRKAGSHSGQPLTQSTAPQSRIARKRGGFQRFARTSARVTGSAVTFGVALMLIAAWAITGPIFHFSDTWQLVINTATTIVTFLMVFLIQNTQNRDARALHLKLDELIRAVKGARNRLVNLEELSDEELEKLAVTFQKIRVE